MNHRLIAQFTNRNKILEDIREIHIRWMPKYNQLEEENPSMRLFTHLQYSLPVIKRLKVLV